MKLEELLSEKRVGIQKRWIRWILESYPGDSQRFLKTQKDRFANPVGYTISQEIENLFLELLHHIDPEKAAPIVDRIVRIRAIQNFSPSQAVAFVFPLKRIIREELVKEIQDHGLQDELLIMEARIDELALLAFDLYMKCKEKLYQIRADEAKNHVSRLLKRAGLICEIPPWDSKEQEGKPNHQAIQNKTR